MRLEDYTSIVGTYVIEELRLLAEKLAGKTIQTINSTAVGGGVAEILHRLVPLLSELGVQIRWDVIRGGTAFFEATKSFHNSLQGEAGQLSEDIFKVFLETTEQNLRLIEFYGDIIFVHDPQPIALVKERYKGHAHWVWRCHIDLSNPQAQVWDFLRPFVEQYDAAVFSSANFAQPLKVKQYLIAPSIDPLSDKNKELTQEFIRDFLEKYQIDPKRPIITQISRFDHFKDPIGVIKAFRQVRPNFDCQLVLAGGEATDDPEGAQVLQEVQAEAGKDKDIHLLLLPPTADLEINALQRGSTIIIQKSLREGFGLTVTEALWKGKPVIASAVGGITLQIKHNLTGILVHSIEGTAYAIKNLLTNPEYARKLGENGREHVRQHYLLTRHLKDYLLLFLAIDRGTDGIVYL
ncbi:MAG: glycosyl transferase family 1 [Nitrospinae bacterium RIFCSPLOWO2_12_FULL_45_22]|nr:MAG: glycosyl transferase family 1 [Nitrospinae bacterium RIFCSPLOWO2_12_FULL_45_22]